MPATQIEWISPDGKSHYEESMGTYSPSDIDARDARVATLRAAGNRVIYIGGYL
jgi:hypothetical protein